MSDPTKILVVDDSMVNRQLLSQILTAQGYVVAMVASGEAALLAVQNDEPDLVLLDVVMPGMDGFEVCRRLKSQDRTRILPVVLVTGLQEREERVRGLDVGADDFLTKPVDHGELLARVRSLLRIKALYDTVQRQAQELSDWGKTLELRVNRQVEEMERLSQLKRFFSPQVADLILSGSAHDPLISRRREIVVVFLDLRGFTSFSEAAEPDDVMRMLGQYHTAMGELIMAHSATLERFAGDGMMIFLNDPVEIPDAADSAVQMAVEMQWRFVEIESAWKSRGIDLTLGVGIAKGQATIGAIGFEGRRDYGAIGVVTNLAARLCAQAPGGQILISRRVQEAIGQSIPTRAAGRFDIKGFSTPIDVHTVDWRQLSGQDD